MRYSMSILLIALFTVIPATAQDQGSDLQEVKEKRSRTVVTYQLQTMLRPSEADVSKLNLGVLDKVSTEESLASLNMGGRMQGSAVTHMKARFVFSSISEFQEWYHSATTQEILKELESKTINDVNASLTVQRYPNAFLLSSDSDGGSD